MADLVQGLLPKSKSRRLNMAHTQMEKRKMSTSFRSQNTDGHMVMKCKPEGQEATSQ